jgi:hypothetical protein
MHECMNSYSSVVLFQISSCYILKYVCVGRLVWDCKSVIESYINYFLLLVPL